MVQAADPAAEIKRLLGVIGIQVSGDLGPLTIYTSKRGKMVAYLRAPPDKRPTQAQLDQRARFRMAQLWWAARSTPEKTQWEDLVRANNLCLTGQNLAMSLQFHPQPGALATANRRANTNVPHPPQV